MRPITRDEYELIEKQATALAASSIVPRDYAGKPANIIGVALMGRTYGWDPTTSMRNFSIIQGTASIKPEAMLGLIRQAGHSVSITDLPDGTGVQATGTRHDNGDTATVTFTLEDARKAGLLRNGPWQQYPLDMCKWRATGRLARELFGDVVLGAGYTPEEIGATSAEDVVQHVEPVAPTDPAEPAEPAVARDWVSEASQITAVDALRALYHEAEAAGAPADDLDAIVDLGRQLKGTLEPAA